MAVCEQVWLPPCFWPGVASQSKSSSDQDNPSPGQSCKRVLASSEKMEKTLARKLAERESAAGMGVPEMAAGHASAHLLGGREGVSYRESKRGR